MAARAYSVSRNLTRRCHLACAPAARVRAGPGRLTGGRRSRYRDGEGRR